MKRVLMLGVSTMAIMIACDCYASISAIKNGEFPYNPEYKFSSIVVYDEFGNVNWKKVLNSNIKKIRLSDDEEVDMRAGKIMLPEELSTDEIVEFSRPTSIIRG